MFRTFFIFLFLACSGLAWADTGSEGICGKLPIDHPKRDNQPSFRLGCERGADGDAQVQLLINGEKPLVLAGVDGEPLAAGNVIFDPASVSVRLLEGQPNLYWIRYVHSRWWEAGSAEIEHRHDLVVQANDTPRMLLDQWSGASFHGRSPVSYRSSVDLSIAYSAASLRVVTTDYGEQHWFDEDWMAFICEQECESQTSAENAQSVPEPCTTNRCRDLYKGANQEMSLIREVRDIDVATGAAQITRRVWAKAYSPVAYELFSLPGERPVSLLVIDDGIAAWLLIPKEPQDLSANSTFDPAEPSAVPAQANCWLYNRADWDQANGIRAYPPAPADQVRSSHFAPDACCVVETSPDGRRIAVHESRSKEEPEKSGRLLALFDVPTQRCYSANLAQSGRWGWAPFDQIGDPVFSPNGQRLGFRAQRGEQRFIVVDNREGPPFHRLSAPVFGPDNRHVAYWARQKGKEFIVLDDRPGPAFDGAGFPVFSPDGSKVAYRAREGNQWFVMRGDEKGPAFDDIGYYTVPDTGRGSDIADVVFSPDGRQLAYAARRGPQWFMVRDGRPGPAFAHVGLPVFGPDGRLAHRARQNDREFILLAGKKGPEFDFVSNPVFSPDGRKVAYWAQQGEQEFVMHGERRGPEFAALGQVGAPVFAGNGRGPIYWARRAEQGEQGYVQTEVLMVGDQPGPTSEYIIGPVLNRHTGEFAYWVGEGNSVFVMHGGQPGPRFDSRSSSGNLVFSPNGRLLAHGAGRDGKQFIHFGDEDDAEFDEVGDPVFSPGADRLAYRARRGDSWFPIIVPLTGQASSSAEPRSAAPVTLPLSQTVPRLIPHPVAVGDWIVGGSTKDRWIGTEAVAGLHFQENCKPLGPEWIDSGLRWKLYSFDQPLETCTASAPLACVEVAYGNIRKPSFPACAVKDYLFAIAAPWNALPRHPKVLKNHQDFAPLVRKFLDSKGLKQAPVRIEYVHSIDLDGDGTEERFINARSSKDCSEISTVANQYAVFVLLRTVKGKPETTVLSESWGESRCLMYTYNSSYADLNGDGIMEILQFGEEGLDVKAFQAGKLVDVPLGYNE